MKSEKKKSYKALERDFNELQAEYMELKEKYELEKCLKNEAYAFLISEGSLNRFKSFQNNLASRNDMEKAVSYLVVNAEPDGEWMGA